MIYVGICDHSETFCHKRSAPVGYAAEYLTSSFSSFFSAIAAPNIIPFSGNPHPLKPMNFQSLSRNPSTLLVRCDDAFSHSYIQSIPDNDLATSSLLTHNQGTSAAKHTAAIHTSNPKINRLQLDSITHPANLLLLHGKISDICT